MSCLEHLIDNGLLTIERLGHNESRKEWMDKMQNDINLPHTNISLEDLWEICQYIKYVWMPCSLESGRYI